MEAAVSLPKADSFKLPQTVGHVFSRLPQWPPSLAFTFGLNLVLAEIANAENLQALHGKRIAIRVTDAGLNLSFTVTPEGYHALSESVPADVVISAAVADFAALALRREDPDTLFFNRRLLIEGDTELGLLIKNTLDAQEPPRIGLSTLAPHRVLAALRTSLFGR
jgi:predicted lipid carrier protein YhbT